MQFPSSAPTPHRQRNGVDHKSGSVIVQNVHNFHYAIADTATDDLPFFSIDLARESAPGSPHNRFDFRNRAAMPGGMFPIPFDPSELRRRHELNI